MSKISWVATVILSSLGLLYFVSGRSTRELSGYCRASADSAVTSVAEALPQEVHDKKLDFDLQQLRQDFIDRQIQMNLSHQQIQTLENEIAELEASTQRRARLLAEAYPLMDQINPSEASVKLAQDEVHNSNSTTPTSDQTDHHFVDTKNRPHQVSKKKPATIRFAERDFTIPLFQREIDDLLAMQKRETAQLTSKKNGREGLLRGVEEGQRAVRSMQQELENVETEIVLLRSRRDQAETVAQTLDIVSSATSNRESAASLFGENLTRLRTNVGKMEARNAARREVAPLTWRENAGVIASQYQRVESLKEIYESENAKSSSASSLE